MRQYCFDCLSNVRGSLSEHRFTKKHVRTVNPRPKRYRRPRTYNTRLWSTDWYENQWAIEEARAIAEGEF